MKKQIRRRRLSKAGDAEKPQAAPIYLGMVSLDERVRCVSSLVCSRQPKARTSTCWVQPPCPNQNWLPAHRRGRARARGAFGFSRLHCALHLRDLRFVEEASKQRQVQGRLRPDLPQLETTSWVPCRGQSSPLVGNKGLGGAIKDWNRFTSWDLDKTHGPTDHIKKISLAKRKSTRTRQSVKYSFCKQHGVKQTC